MHNSNGTFSAAVHPNKRTTEDVFRDYQGRHAGLVKALTQDVEEFFRQCDPEKENLCLYGLPTGTWEVNLPSEEVPPEIPEPALGINFARDGMAKKDWLSLVAIHSDAWLLSVAFYFAGRLGFDKEARKRLSVMINNLPTVFEALSGSDKKQARTPNGSSRNKSGSKPPRQSNHIMKPPKQEVLPKFEEDNGAREERGDEVTMCGVCGVPWADDGFWIGCDVCEKWYHGECVHVTASQAERLKKYKCPDCLSNTSNKRSRDRAWNISG